MTMQSIYRESTKNNLNFYSVVSLRVHTNIQSGLTKIVSIRPVQQCPVTDLSRDDRKKFSIPYVVSDDPKLG